jgi:hypothetical protein
VDPTFTDEDYACLLCVLKIFVSLFEPERDDDKKGLQNTLVGIITGCLRFPPATRAIYDLVDARIPSPEDRAALSQCLLEYFKIRRDPTRSFDLQFPRLTLGHIYALVKSVPPSTSFRNLESFATQNFECPITKETLDRAICFKSAEENSLVDPNVGPLHCDGPLRRTVFKLASRQERSIASRLAVYCGGRYEKITYFTAPILESRPPTINPGSNAPNKRDPFAIVAPKDLPTVPHPALTRNERGEISVYMGKSKAGEPVKYYLLNCVSVYLQYTTI